MAQAESRHMVAAKSPQPAFMSKPLVKIQSDDVNSIPGSLLELSIGHNDFYLSPLCYSGNALECNKT